MEDAKVQEMMANLYQKTELGDDVNMLDHLHLIEKIDFEEGSYYGEMLNN